MFFRKKSQVVVREMYTNVERTFDAIETDEELTYKDGNETKTVCKNHLHMKVRHDGSRVFYVRGTDEQTYDPFYTLHSRRNVEVPREVIGSVIKHSLLKSLTKKEGIPLVFMVAFLVVGFSIGVMAGVYMAPDNYDQRQWNENYYPEDAIDNGTVIVAFMRGEIFTNINVNNVMPHSNFIRS